MELIAVGRIVRPQGRRGEVRVEPLTDEPGRLAELRECYLVPPAGGEQRRVETVWFQGEVPVLKLAGADSLDAAEALAGRLVSISRAAVRPLPPGHFYCFELIGCTVRTPEGALLGTLADVMGGEHHDLWVLRAGEREHLIPAVSEIVERVDLDERVVVVRPPEGLLELG
ncbi:MAG: 16S rRNA processing protein RimM [Candidatus Rokubacteria bacterium]|nr:16S rRNA processing protein RimM [Candidatus Rokubacteria bacterium]